MDHPRTDVSRSGEGIATRISRPFRPVGLVWCKLPSNESDDAALSSLFDFLMASNLVAYYLYRTGASSAPSCATLLNLIKLVVSGRFLEGHHQTAGASRFAVRWE